MADRWQIVVRLVLLVKTVVRLTGLVVGELEVFVVNVVVVAAGFVAAFHLC